MPKGDIYQIYVYPIFQPLIIITLVSIFIFYRTNASYGKGCTDENPSFSALAFCAAKTAMSATRMSFFAFSEFLSKNGKTCEFLRKNLKTLAKREREREKFLAIDFTVFIAFASVNFWAFVFANAFVLWFANACAFVNTFAKLLIVFAPYMNFG